MDRWTDGYKDGWTYIYMQVYTYMQVWLNVGGDKPKGTALVGPGAESLARALQAIYTCVYVCLCVRACVRACWRAGVYAYMHTCTQGKTMQGLADPDGTVVLSENEWLDIGLEGLLMGHYVEAGM